MPMRVAVTLVTMVLLAVGAGMAAAQPAAKPDFARAAELYKQAEAEMAAGKFADAARDYAVAFEITQDPVLYFKIAGAQERAGRCDLALTYYRRYLGEGKPNDEYKKLTGERIAACEKIAGKSKPPEKVPEKVPDKVPEKMPDKPVGPVVDDSTAQLSGNPPSLSDEHPSRKRSFAWIALGVGTLLGAAGVVSAMSAEAAEKDIQDLYDTRVGGSPLPYNAEIQQRHDDLVAQGNRYQKLSWVAFGAAGAMLVTSTVLFVASAGDHHEQPPVAVQVTGDGASVVAGWQF